MPSGNVERQILASAQYEVKDIILSNLFGVKEQAAPNPKVKKAPETKLKLTLLGVLTSEQDKYARAFIQVASNNMRVYSVGDAIEGTDAALHKVEGKRVIIDRKGTLESLIMIRPKARLAEPVSPELRFLKKLESKSISEINNAS